ncbi:MAG: hypothetical protein EKK64_08070 [Neisseriaceae bacterium]|nr:MAG: hypothetical protein EKK64_08070 [Neisseriaceae bacterium]
MLKLIFQHVSEGTKGLILETLYCVYTPESVDLFIEFVSDINNEVDNYTSYETIKAFANADQKIIERFTINADKLLQYNKFRTVAFVELFSQWAADKKISYNPLGNNLQVIEKWIKDANYQKLSYAVSGCAALVTVNSEESIRLLEIASQHSKLEIQLETAFVQILLGQEKAKDKLRVLAQNPIISIPTFLYSQELKQKYGIDCGFTKEDILEKIDNEEDFLAISQMAWWCAHPQEYGITPDSIKVWAKEVIYWPPNDEKLKVFLIKYRYDNYKWQGRISNIEHVGYFIPCYEKLFSIMQGFDDIYAAYATYSIKYNKGDIEAS